MRYYALLAFCCFIVMTWGVALADTQYVRDPTNGSLHIQQSPGARAKGPYRNLPQLIGGDFTFTGSEGTRYRRVRERPTLVKILQSAVAGRSPVVAGPTPLSYSRPLWYKTPYMKICRHLAEGIVCEEFDMSNVLE